MWLPYDGYTTPHLWSSGSAYLDGGGPNNPTIYYNRLTPPGGSGSHNMGSAPAYIAMGAYMPGENQYKLVWYYYNSIDNESFMDKISRNDFGTTFTLFVGNAEDAAPYLGTWELSEWDDSPSLDPENDPDNTLPIGGENAELEPFNTTVQQSLNDLLEPETFNYGSFLTAYQLYPSDMQTLGNYLFDTSFWTSLKNKFQGLSDPMSFIISAVEIPFSLGVVPTTFKLGGVEVTDGNGNPINCSKHTQRYLKNSFGTIKLCEVWGTAKDYTDCDISIFLPYVGMRSIDPDLGVNAELTLACIVDVWTGDINYMLQVNNANNNGKYFASSGVPYRWSGNCGNHVPIGKVDPSSPILNVASSLGSIALGAGLMMATGGAAAPAAGAAAAGAGAAGAGIAGAAGAGAGASMMMGGAKSFFGDLTSGFSPLVQSSGNVSGAIGYLDFQYPYLVIKRGVPKYPNGWREYFGAPNYQQFQGVSLSGYTLFSEIHIIGMNDASEAERAELERLLCTEGVIL